MTEKPHLPEPQYFLEAEALIGLPAFENPDVRFTALHQSIHAIPEDMASARHVLYFGALRILAKARNSERTCIQRQAEWNEAWSQSLSRSKLGEIAAAASEEIDDLGKRFSAILKKERKARAHNALLSGLRKHQLPYMEGITDFMNESPQMCSIADSNGVVFSRLVHGACVEAPTGSGKTALIGRSAVAAGIGETFTDQEGKQRKRRMLVVVPTQSLVEQFTGKSGDDTFRRFAQDLSVGAYYAKEKTDDTDVVVISIRKFNEAFCDNKLNGTEFDLLAIDEAHNLTQPQFLDTFLQQWSGPTLGFTATPDRSELRDVRKILPSTIKHADTLGYIMEGVLNGAQLFLFRIDPQYDQDYLRNTEAIQINREQIARLRQEAIDQATLEFVEPLLKEGRRGIIFCNPGDKSLHARGLAEKISKIKLEDGRNVRAECMASTYSKSNLRPPHEIIDDYNKGEVDVLLTVDMAKEGFNADLDFVILARNIRSSLVLRQCIGRGTRLSKKFPYTVYGQFIVPSLESNIPVAPLHEAFGVDTVTQGLTIGPSLASGRTSRLNEDAKRLFKANSLPIHMQDLLRKVENRLASEVHLTYKDDVEVPEGYVSVFQLAKPLEDRGLHPRDVSRRLERAGYAWVGKPERVEGRLILHRFFEPNAASFFQENPIPPRATPNIKTFNMLQNELEISPGALERIIAEMTEKTDFKPVPRINNLGRVWDHYEEDAIDWIRARIEQIPTKQERDVTIEALAADIGEPTSSARQKIANKGIRPQYKRIPGIRKSKKNDRYGWFYSQAQRERIIAEFGVTPWAEEGDVSIPQIATEAKITLSAAHKALTEEEKELGYFRRVQSKRGSDKLIHFPREIADIVVARIKEASKPLPVIYIPVVGLQKILNISDKKMPYGYGDKAQQIKLASTRSRSYVTWDIAQQIAERYGYKPGVEHIDFSRLPQSEEETNPDKIAYAREVQLRFMTKGQLGL